MRFLPALVFHVKRSAQKPGHADENATKKKSQPLFKNKRLALNTYFTAQRDVAEAEYAEQVHHKLHRNEPPADYYAHRARHSTRHSNSLVAAVAQAAPLGYLAATAEEPEHAAQ